MHVLVTRPEPGASELRVRLEHLGHAVTLAPLMRLELFPPPAALLADAQALIATSRNALEAIALSPHLAGVQRVPLFAVGPATAHAARAKGFARVVEGGGTARELVPLIVEEAEPAGGPLVHLAGAKLAFDLAGALAREGFRILSPVVYRASQVDRLPTSAEARLRDGSLDAVMLLSPETARAWDRLVRAAGLTEKARAVRHVCLSRGVANAVSSMAPYEVTVAARPRLEEMLALLVG